MPSSISARRSSKVPFPGSRWRFVMRTSGIRLQPSARIDPPAPAPIRAAVSREVRKPRKTPASTIVCDSAATPSSSQAKVPSPPGDVGSAVTFISPQPYLSEPGSLGWGEPGPAYPAPVGARVAADLRLAVEHREGVDPAAALHDLLLDRGSVGGDEDLALALCAHRRLRHLHVWMGERRLGAQAVLDLLLERDLDRVALGLRPVRPARGRDGREPARVVTRSGARERDRPPRRLGGAGLRQAPVAGEPPRAADEDPDAEAFRLDVANRLDAAVLRRDVLAPAGDGPRIRVGGAGRERGFHGRGAEVAHAAYLIGRQARAPWLQWRGPRAGGGIGRRARLRALWPVWAWRFKSSPAH